MLSRSLLALLATRLKLLKIWQLLQLLILMLLALWIALLSILLGVITPPLLTICAIAKKGSTDWAAIEVAHKQRH